MVLLALGLLGSAGETGLVNPSDAKPQNREISGRVVGENNEPISGASVSLFGPGQPGDSTNAVNRTDQDGSFSFKNLCEGRVRISANLGVRSGSVWTDTGDTNLQVKIVHPLVPIQVIQPPFLIRNPRMRMMNPRWIDPSDVR